jgi:NTP pyrophosphatase (non-canonical NTP hydrolase)
MDNKIDLMEEIVEYTSKRQYVMPNVWQAMGWVNAEIGEVYEVLLDWSATNWVRNNPEKHPHKTKEDLATELGDVIFMLMLAGYSEGVNPLEALKTKMRNKLDKINEESKATTSS